MTFPTLYKKTSTGSTQQWQIEVVDNKYRTLSGKVGGKIVISDWTICTIKNQNRSNETTAEQQAQMEAKAKFDKQLKHGYFENIQDIGKLSYVQPMLAKVFKDRKDKIEYPVGVQNKFNGTRCIATKDGLFTRKGERYFSVPHIWNSLKPFFEEHPDAVLDGELFNESLKQHLNELVSICLKKKIETVTEEDIQKSEQIVRYYVYDGYNFANITQDTPYLERESAIYNALKDTPYYCRVETVIANNEEEVYVAYQVHVDAGHEGAIVRFLNTPYENKRSAYLLKVKPTDDAEFLVLDVEEGNGNRGGMAGRVILEMNDGSKRTFASNLKGEESQFAEVLQNKTNYIGKMATIFYNGFTGKGLPNYAQFDCNNSIKE